MPDFLVNFSPTLVQTQQCQLTIPSLPQALVSSKASLAVRYSHTGETHVWVWLRVGRSDAAESVCAFTTATRMPDSWELTVVVGALGDEEEEPDVPGAQVAESADVPLVRAGKPLALDLWAYRPLDGAARLLDLGRRQHHI